MIVFKHVWLLSLLPLPALVYLLVPVFRQRANAIRIPFFDLVAKTSGAHVGSGSEIFAKPWLDIVFASLIWGLLVVALALPVRLGEPVTEQIVSRDIMLTLDLSGSMEEKDFPSRGGALVSRLDGVKQVVTEFIRQRQDDRIGLIVFGTRAYLQVPFTQDLASAEKILNDLSVSMAGPHTAVGDAIGLAIKHFQSSDVKNRLLILLTDGADTGSQMSPKNAAHIAEQEGLTVYTIGIGDENADGQYRVDFDTLRDISAVTNGAFYSAENADALANVYAEIDKVSASKVEQSVSRSESSLVPELVTMAAVIVLLSMLLRSLQIAWRGRHV
ncbi:VWA domain-containing protein [Gilvimarinus sp. SDUM040013]|uniref:VWA domain-containing protein n=1 Tax=Gilvimarinus gilvus TaxID=3058038 RepID=A0ABU4RUV2_9GAMM|nr:VWA domain-containing protein [Gilvimarinus sp. SDUM040013]MDO3388476.1 VWA domain-containing protein [Gilvimarinus sp. SDUM040013]MDX6848652.1 VWA domain-containing protein [Gilvimarinus sp. SDUM040013]